MNLETYGWTESTASLFNEISNPGLVPARVLRADRGEVLLFGGEGAFKARMAGLPDPQGEAPPAVTGDWVAVDRSEDTAVVRAIVPRRSALTRRRAGAAESAQVVAANVDRVVIVDGLDRGPNRRRIERGIALAYAGGAVPLVVLNKADLCPDQKAARAVAAEAAPFCDLVLVSAEDGTGLAELVHLLGENSTAVLIGPSGAGKSTLTNALLGESRLETGAVRSADAKGRHTTTRSELVVLPSGGCLIDTPGIRELGLWLDADAVDAAFSDIEELAAACRFADCAHRGEPGCAVAEAVAGGDLPASRLESYHKLRREAEVHELRFDASKAHDARRADRRFARLCRAEVKRKNNR